MWRATSGRSSARSIGGVHLALRFRSRLLIRKRLTEVWGKVSSGSALVAAEMASRRVRSCTGLRRKADAPPAMARSRAFGKSWPVTMMTGSAAHFRARCVCTLNPSMCGMCRSRTTQSGRRVSSDFKNSAPDPNVSTLKPAERIKRISAVRTGSSSSTTAMSRSALVTGARG